MEQEPERPEVSPEVASAIKEVEAAQSFTPKAELVRHFGEERLREWVDDSGKLQWEIKLDSGRQLQEFDEMDRPRARIETQAAHEAYARVEVVMLRASTGRTWEVPASLAKQLCDSPLGRSLGVREIRRTRPKHALYAVSGPGGVRRVR